MMDIAEIKVRAGNWKAILTALGVPAGCLTGKHSPCPACGGKDRFRFTDYHGNGDYICNQCGNGDGFDLLMKVFGYSFVECRNLVANHLGINAETPVKAPERRFKPLLPKKGVAPAKDSLKRIQGYLWGAKPITQHCPAGNYLRNRGLDWLAISDGLQHVYYREALDYWALDSYGRPFKVGEYAAMVAKISKDTELMGVHLTYLQNHKGVWRKARITHPVTGEPLPAKKMQTRYSGATTGAGVALYRPQNGMITVCEGIETALAVRQLFGLPVWACLSANGLINFALPSGIHTLYIVSDNDANGTGYQAMQKLSARAMNAGLQVQYWQPETVGHDALDALNHTQKTTQ